MYVVLCDPMGSLVIISNDPPKPYPSSQKWEGPLYVLKELKTWYTYILNIF